MSDTESYVYRYSWDKEDLSNYPWKEHYVKQPEVLAYLNHVADKHDLRKDMRFNTQLQDAHWDDNSKRWNLKITGGKTITSRYLVTGLGLLSKQNYPDIPGIDSFQGDIHHTAKWPKGYSVEGKRVGVIGSGSTGVQVSRVSTISSQACSDYELQVITEIGRKVKELTCFQRHPQYSVPSGDDKVAPEYRKWVNENYDDIWKQVRGSITAFGFEESA